MTKHNANNERIKRQYFAYLKEAKRYSEDAVDMAASALARYGEYTKHRDFKTFHREQAIAFKKHLAQQNSRSTGGKLSKATLYSSLAHLKRFFHWLAGQPGYKSRLSYSDAEYFNLSEKDSRVATARRQRPVPTLEQIKHVIANMPAKTEIEQRDRAVVAFAILTGARDRAISTIRLKHVDMVTRSVFQDAREVETKFSKSFTTFFFPVGDEICQIVADWISYLRNDCLWGNEDPLFPATRTILGPTNQFESAGVHAKQWSNATPIRTIFRAAFTTAGLPYFNPHSFRNTLVRLGETLCKSPEDFKAWSQNLGHEQVLTTFTSYGEVPSRRQGELIQALSVPDRATPPFPEDFVDALAKALRARALAD